jgi:type I restriction enzyme, S subunit
MTRLGDAADMLVGFAFKSAGFLDAEADGIPLLRGDNVQQGYIRWGDKTKKWPTAEVDEFERYQLTVDDVILAMDRPIVGDGLKMAWIKPEDLPCLLVQRVSRLRGKPNVALTRFIRYVLAAPAFSDHIHRITTGANIPHISGKDIAAYEFHLPGIDEQAAVVECLSAYDDLIATNQRRIALLEDAARRVYREWFVHLRFPGHESVQFRGGMPAGWHMQALSAIAEVNARSVGSNGQPELLRYIDISSVTPGVVGEMTEYAFAAAPGRARRRVSHGDVIWSCVRPNRRSYALIWQPADNVVASTGFAVLSASKVPFSYLYLATTTDEFVGYLEQNATGAAYPAVTSKNFEDAEVICPDTDTLVSFDKLVLPMLSQIETLKTQKASLARARDLLLPKLMSGKLDVSLIRLPEEATT